MASLTFEGEFKDLNFNQIQFIQDVLTKRGFINNKVVFEPATKVGDNYGSVVKRIIVEVENGDNFQMIAKVAQSDNTFRNMMMTDLLFSNESQMYKEILPKFSSLQKNAGVPTEDLLKYAECYGCLMEPPHELILLEDLKPLNYSILNKDKPLTNDAVKLIYKNFAILHSLSFVLKKLEPNTYNALKDKLTDAWKVANNKPENEQMSVMIEKTVLDTVLDDQFYKDAIRGSITSCGAVSKKLNNRDNGSKYSVILQGDAWTNNIMFKVVSANGYYNILILFFLKN
jgi:hypothetical protein